MQLGMYIRTPKGRLGRIVGVRETRNKKPKYLIEWSNGQIYYMVQVDDFKASHKIIDLIQVGDYVNGYKITSIQEINEYYPKRLLYSTDESCDEFILLFNNGEIKSIVTKQQFENIAYKVGDQNE